MPPMPQFSATTDEACEALRISDSSLRRLRKEGVLQPGIHFRAIGGGQIRPALIWDVDASDLALARRSRRLLR